MHMKKTEEPGRKKTIRKRILYPFTAVLMLQAFLILLIIWSGGMLDDLRSNAMTAFTERVESRKVYLELDMQYHWCRIEEIEKNIQKRIAYTLKRERAGLEDIRTDSELNAKILETTAKDVIDLMRTNMVTGAFLVLDGQGTESDERSYASFYVRDMDPNSYSESSSDLFVERGLRRIAKSVGLALDSSWTSCFRFENEEDPAGEFFFKPLQAAREYANENSVGTDFGYWCSTSPLSSPAADAVTYSIPLMKDGIVYGVLGVDVTQQYVRYKLYHEELLENEKGIYLLAKHEKDSNSYQIILSDGLGDKSGFSENDEISVVSEADHTFRILVQGENGGQEFIGNVQSFQLYGEDSPFVQEEWVLIGMTDKKNLFKTADEVWRKLIITAAFSSFILGILGVYFISWMIVKPITALMEEMKSSDPSKPIRLKRIHIDEIDMLAQEVEQLSTEVSDAASRLSRIIEISDLPVAVFEYPEGGATVQCSGNIFRILHLSGKWEKAGSVSVEEFRRLMDVMKSYQSADKSNVYCIKSQEGENWIRLLVEWEGERCIGLLFDITKEILEKQKMKYERDHDRLTKMYNRYAFVEHLDQIFGQPPSEIRVGAMLMWDLDNLKYINDTYGHDFGDTYICSFSECLNMLPEDKKLVARRSGDEFYTFFYGYDSEEEIREDIRRLREKISRTQIRLPNGEWFSLKVSGGIAWYPRDSVQQKELVRYADFAMYSVKHSDKGSTGEFDLGKYQENEYLISAQGDLNRLIDERLIDFAFQPIVYAKDGTIYGYEMLMRGKIGRLRNPGAILKLAASQSKLVQIECLTFFCAMEKYEQLLHKKEIPQDVKLFINSIRSAALSKEDWEEFQKRFAKYFDRLVVEITESEPADAGMLLDKVRMFQSAGTEIAIDDLGTGYNSEAVILALNPGIVKLDISLIRDIHRDRGRQKLLDGIVKFAHSQETLVLAEGIESREEMEYLIRNGIDLVQGYYLGRAEMDVRGIPVNVQEEIRQISESILQQM